jgi:DNA repair protein RadC
MVGLRTNAHGKTHAKRVEALLDAELLAIFLRVGVMGKIAYKPTKSYLKACSPKQVFTHAKSSNAH